MTKTTIDWCDYTWNPVWGCLNDCPYCYARGISKRFWKQIWNIEEKYRESNNMFFSHETPKDLFEFKPFFLESAFEKHMPKKPSIIFVNSMSDPVFWMPEWIERVNNRIADHPEHKFIVLTKYGKAVDEWPLHFCNLKIGMTFDDTIGELFNCEYLEFFEIVNFEPLLRDFSDEELDYILSGKELCIIGAETGNRKGKVEPKAHWVIAILDACERHNVLVFEFCLKWNMSFLRNNPYRL